MENLHTRGLLGQAREVDGQSFPSSWEAIVYLANKVDEAGGADPQSTQELAKALQDIDKLKAGLASMGTFCTGLLDKLKEVNTQLGSLGHSVGQSAPPAPRIGTTACSTMSFASIGDPGAALKARLDLMDKRINDLAAKFNLEHICMASLTMDTEVDLCVWVKEHLSLLAFGMFVDPLVVYQMALSEMGSVDAMLMIMDKVRKLGLHGPCEAQAVVSMEVAVPTIWGGIGTSTDPLPKVPKYTKWSDGSSSDFKSMLEQSIDTAFSKLEEASYKDLGSSAEAILLASEC